MTREQVKKLFPDAAEEQISAILDANSADIGKAKKGGISDEELQKLKDKAKLHDDYEETQKTSEEKLTKALKEAEDLKLSNLKLLNKTKAAGVFVAAGMTEEEYSTFIDGIVSDNEENTLALANSLVSTLNAKVEAKEKSVKAELLKSTPTPPAGGGGSEVKTEAEKIAEARASAAVENNKAANTAMNHYLGG